jgi:hypothetical protein
MTIVPGSETDVAKLVTSIRGGVAPDVYMADRFTVPQRAAERSWRSCRRPPRPWPTSTSHSPGRRRSTRARPTRSRSTRTPGPSGTTRIWSRPPAKTRPSSTSPRALRRSPW